MKSNSPIEWVLGALIAIASVDAVPDPPGVNPRTVSVTSRLCAGGGVGERRLHSDWSSPSHLRMRWIAFSSPYESNLPSDRIVRTGQAADPSPPVLESSAQPISPRKGTIAMLLAESVRPSGDILSRKLIDLGSAPASRRDLAAHGGQSCHRQKRGRQGKLSSYSGMAQDSQGRAALAATGCSCLRWAEQIISRSAFLRYLSEGKPCLSFPLLIAVSRHPMTFV
jgi:hypothetical protein